MHQNMALNPSMKWLCLNLKKEVKMSMLYKVYDETYFQL